MWIEIVGPVVPVLIFLVTPFAGVWIEIDGTGKDRTRQEVTPFAGVWIEMRHE